MASRTARRSSRALGHRRATLIGAQPPGTVRYELPASGYAIVDLTNGNNSNSGTLASPKATIQGAYSAGFTTAVLRGGTHHYGVAINAGSFSTSTIYAAQQLNSNNFKIQPYLDEAVWLDGSTVVSSWTNLGGGVWSKAFVATMDRSPTDTYGQLDSDNRPGWKWVDDTNFPTAAWSEAVYVDGVRLTQVTSQGAVTSGKFYVAGTTSGTNNMLFTSTTYYIGDDPTGKEVRISDLATCFSLYGDNMTVEGIGVRRFGTTNWMGGAVKIADSDGCTLRNVSIEDASSGQGVLVYNSTNALLENCTVLRAGNMGYKSFWADNLTIRKCKATNSNYERYNFAPASGGAKITASRDFVFDRNEFNDNYSPGLWFDVSCYNTQVVNSDFLRNSDFGCMFEIGCVALSANNRYVQNGGDGLKVLDTGQIVSINDTSWANGTGPSSSDRNIAIYRDDRRTSTNSYGQDSRQTFPDPTMDEWEMRHIYIKNALMGENSQFGAPSAEDFMKATTQSVSYTSMDYTINNNLISRTSTGQWVGLLPGTGAAQNLATTTSAWTGLGMDTSSIFVVAETLVDSNGNTLSAADSYHASALALPSTITTTDGTVFSVASLIGQAAGTKRFGAFPRT